jgi:hypothetical protein
MPIKYNMCVQVMPMKYPHDEAWGRNGILWSSGVMAEAVHMSFLRGFALNFTGAFAIQQADIPIR